MGIALALISAVAYGGGDFFGGLAARRASTFAVVAGSQGFGLLLMLAAVAITGGSVTASDLAWGAGCGLGSAVGIGFLYRGLATGTMGVVSPISAVVGAAIPVAFGIAIRGERPGTIALSGVALALAAVILVSVSDAAGDANTPRRRSPFPPGVGEALIAGVGFGVWYVTLAQTHAAAGMIPLFVGRAVSVSLIVATALFTGGAAQLRVTRPALLVVLLSGTLDISANVLYTLAAHSNMLSLVAVLTSLYPATTIVLAAIVLHERLNRWQCAGVVSALAGVAAITGASH